MNATGKPAVGGYSDAEILAMVDEENGRYDPRI